MRCNYYKDDPDKQTECRKKIWDGPGLLLELVNEVLDMGKLRTGEIMLEEREFDLKELLDSVGIVVDKQARSEALRYTTDGYRLSTAACSAVRCNSLRRLLMNIIDNAVQSTTAWAAKSGWDAAKSRVRIRRLHRLNSPVRIPVSA